MYRKPGACGILGVWSFLRRNRAKSRLVGGVVSGVSGLSCR